MSISVGFVSYVLPIKQVLSFIFTNVFKYYFWERQLSHVYFYKNVGPNMLILNDPLH